MIEEAHRAAQARLGIAGAYLALREWNGVSPTAPLATSGTWLLRSLKIIRALRRKSTRLAVAYYQLARAIETGYTLGLPEYSEDPKAVTMGGLRKQYLNLLTEIAQIEQPESAEVVIPNSTKNRDEEWLERELQDADNAGRESNPKADLLKNLDLESYIEDLIEDSEYDTDDDPVEVDPYEWEEDVFTDEELEAIYTEQLQKNAAGQEEKAKKVKRTGETDQLDRLIAGLEEDHAKAGSTGAGQVDAAGMNAGRQVLSNAYKRDRRVQMIARGTGPNPCAFCAMLASRGFVYRDTKTAGFNTNGGNDVEKYHPNCHCFPVVRWADIPDPTAPGRSEFYKANWRDVTKDFAWEALEGGKGRNHAYNAWRRWLNAERKAGRIPTDLAPIRASRAKKKTTA